MQDLHSFPPLVPYGTTFPPAERWDNNALLNSSLKNCSMSKAGCCAPACGGKVVAPATKGGLLPTGSIYIHRRQAIPQLSSHSGIYSSAAARIRPLSEADTTLSPRVSAGLSPLRRRRAPPPAFGNTVQYDSG
jgi:hypothetical protein